MDIKKIVINVAVAILAEKGIIRKPDSMDAFVANLFGTETSTDRAIREIDAASDKMIEAAKKMHTNYKFNKVTKNF
jgi:hypothetical protein